MSLSAEKLEWQGRELNTEHSLHPLFRGLQGPEASPGPRASGGREAARPRPSGRAPPHTFSGEGDGEFPADLTGHWGARFCFQKAHNGGHGFMVSPTEGEG